MNQVIFQNRLVYIVSFTALASLGYFGFDAFSLWRRHIPLLPFTLHWGENHWVFIGLMVCFYYFMFPLAKRWYLDAERKRIAKLPKYTTPKEGVWPPAPKES